MRVKQALQGFGLIAAAAITAIAWCGPVLAQAQIQEEAKWPPPGVSFYGDPGVPDVSGLWLGTITGVPGVPFAPNRGSADGRPPTYYAPWPLPYSPKYQAIVDARSAASKQGKALGDINAKCLPFGLPLMLVSKVYPDEIVQTPGQVTLFMYNTNPVMIWTDGRPHPSDLKPSYNGHSIGYWVGNTLFVDTVGLVPNTTIDSGRDPHSGQLHIRWSIQKVGPDILHMHVTLYDEDAFKEPVTTTNIWHRKTDPKWQVLDDASCWENNESKTDSVPAGGFFKF